MRRRHRMTRDASCLRGRSGGKYKSLRRILGNRGAGGRGRKGRWGSSTRLAAAATSRSATASSCSLDRPAPRCSFTEVVVKDFR